jgi:Ca2+-binding RTX toxin-like protein
VGPTISIPGSGNVDLTVYGRNTVIAGNGNDKIDITGTGKIIVGSGRDTLTLNTSGVISQQGSSGHDTINLGTGNDSIYEQGSATVTGAFSNGSFGQATVAGGVLEVVHTPGHSYSVTEDIAVSGKMTLIGSAAPTEFVGGPGATYMIGGAGNDTFIGGSGHDTMVGGSAQNLFEFGKDEEGGQHLIKNFVSGEDQLVVEGHSLSYLKQHGDISTHGGNTYISIDGGKTTIELQGVATLKASDLTGYTSAFTHHNR